MRVFKFFPCFLTFLRIAAIPVFAVLIVNDLFSYAVAAAVFICLTDLFDGFTARRLHACTKFGAQLDVYADLIYILTSLFALNIKGSVPFWFTAAVIFKFIEFTVTSLILKNRNHCESAWVFDITGRCFSALAFLSPGVLCLAAFYKVSVAYIAYVFLFPACAFAVISSVIRIACCIKTQRQMKGSQLLL